MNFKSKKAIHNFQHFKESSSMKKKYQTEQTKEFLKTEITSEIENNFKAKLVP